MKFGALFMENFKIAVASVRSNTLRTTLTVLIIAFGIMALVGIQTAIDSLKSSVQDSFSSMGTLSFSLTRSSDRFRLSNRRDRKRGHEHVSYYQAQEFKERFKSAAYVTISTNISGTATAKYLSEKTDPNSSVQGVDEDFLTFSGLELENGRNFSSGEVRSAINVAIIGIDIVKVLFKGSSQSAIDKDINLDGIHYRVIGVIKPKGAAFSNGPDRKILIPTTNARVFFPRPNQNFKIEIRPHDPLQMDYMMEEAEGLFRQIRRIAPGDPSDFDVNRSDGLAQEMFNILGYASIAAFVIGFITLLGAAVGLMNIMLVSVSERTREIGTRKAIGAKSATIRQQFLFEAILIGQAGGLLGVFLGILVGNLVSQLAHGNFVVPWIWVITGVSACFIVSIVSGYLPATKAAKLDPIEALRYE